MAVDDIGYLIFVQIFGMTEYPGAPFTGDILRDVVLFVLIPSVFIILFVYMLLGRLFLPSQSKLRLLLGVSIYLFIWAGGYYRTFALLAGPYFIFLIFILGLVYFIPAHFGIRQEGGVAGGGVGGRGEKGYVPELNPAERRRLQNELKRIDERLDRLRKKEESMLKTGAHGVGSVTLQIEQLTREREVIVRQLRGRLMY